MTDSDTTSSAVLSPCGLYRYRLHRCWDKQKPGIVFIMLNPSSADALMDDPTIRRCKGFASIWGFGSMEVVNLFAYRTKNPMELMAAEDPAGPENINYLLQYASGNNTVVCAWGNENLLRKLGAVNGKDILPPAIRNKALKIIKLSGKGIPCHPLYLRKTEVLRPWP